jgi:glycosyltransferase involved in cell wall biosynthesis
VTGTIPKVTVFTYSYPPGYLGGGPTRSVHGLVEALADDFRFSVVTSALDGPAATGPMPSVTPDRWSTHGQARVWYESRPRMTARTIARLLRDSQPDIVYLNSLFSYRFAILPLITARLCARRAVLALAPRGELSAGALALKSAKKHLFLALFRRLGLHRTVVWHASTAMEKADIEREFGPQVNCFTAIDLRRDLFGAPPAAGERTAAGAPPADGERTGNSLVFFSRISPKKNLVTAIQALALVPGDVHLSVAGPIEDAAYWDQCRAAIGNLADPGRVSYAGEVAGEDVVAFLGDFDLLVLPTLGENFGHVVLEALAAGTPVIVGDGTPWRQLETAGAGWLCDPSSPESVAGLIERFRSLPAADRRAMREAARKLARSMLSDPQPVEDNRRAFRQLVAAKEARDPSLAPASARPRLGIVDFNPIQYHVPLYQELAERSAVQLSVLYLSDRGLRPAFDSGFGVPVAWDIDLLSGYQNEFLPDPGPWTRRLWQLTQWIKSQDVVVIHGHSDPWMLIAMAACRAARVPYLLRGDSGPDGRSGGWRGAVRWSTARAVVSGCAGGLAVGERNRQFYRRYQARRITFAPYSVDNDRFAKPPAVGRAELLARWELDPTLPVIMFCGKLQPHKQPLQLAAAVNRMTEPVTVLFVGDGELASQVTALLKPGRGRVTGFINQVELPAYYHAADILVMPSEFEPWGLVVNEAMAAGVLPVVSDRVGCGPDLVQGIGEIYPCGDVGALATALSRAIRRCADPQLRVRLRNRVACYSITATAEGFERAARAVTSRPPTQRRS